MIFLKLLSFLQKIKPYWLTLETHCLLCLANTGNQTNVCNNCKNDLPLISQACHCCGLPLSHLGLCGQCLQHMPSYTTVIAPYRYEFPIAQLINRFKHQQQWVIGRLLAELLAEQLQQHYLKKLDKPALLIPVPLAKERFRMRGFNQAEIISHQLSHQLNIKTNLNILYKRLDTIPQQGLSAKDRLKNLNKAFEINVNANINNQHIAIIDDVVTTGSTANTLASLLISKGARRVDIYAIARTPQFFK